MALSSSMYAAVTGLAALGAGMQTISNNIANVNTVGFKAGRTNYEDLISQNYFSGGRVNQRGCGVKVSTIQSMFTQGAFMSSAQDTDMAIAGEGFFSVRNAVTNAIQYTRAGVFTMDDDGYMEDPSGNILQGWQMSIPKPGQDPVRLGAPTDIKIVTINAPPVETSQIKIVTNLNADAENTFKYKKDQLAVDYATSLATSSAKVAEEVAVKATWNPLPKGTDTKVTLEDDTFPLVHALGRYTNLNPSTIAGFPADQSVPGLTIDPDQFNKFFLELFNSQYVLKEEGGTRFEGTVDDIAVFQENHDFDAAQRNNGWMTKGEFDTLVTQATAQMEALAERNGLDTYTRTYNEKYNREYANIANSIREQWQIEGSGFADAWDASKTPHIDPENYSHPEPITIYDSLGTAHKLSIYYQPNPVMENVWDYIITCDPLEDARKDGNLSLLFSETATFSGLIQKGKITFSGDGSDRHGGVIKDIEAQNLDLGKSKMAVIGKPQYNAASASTLMQTATIGGYYNGSPAIDPSALKNSGIMYEATSRTYTISWGSGQESLNAWTTRYASWWSAQNPSVDPYGPNQANQEAAYEAAHLNDPKPDPFNTSAIAAWRVGYEAWCTDPAENNPALNPNHVANEARYVADTGIQKPLPLKADDWSHLVPGSPPQSGFTVMDSLGNVEYIPITDVNHPGPYLFGSGLTITFNPDMMPLSFGQPGTDALSVSTSSEQIAWTKVPPNDQGYFDFDVAFVESASMALHPPYPSGMPTIIQNVAFDMGAKYNGTNPKWVLDELSTTQYAGETSTAFSGQDGFPAGSLQRVSIGEDGVVTGIYSNGRHQALYQIGLTRFMNPWGLSKEGDNLFSETRYSGSGALNPPGYGGTGTILANFLEQSNVDLAEEIVNMIVTQRGFQANSKTVTTTDTMLAEVIEMKR